MDLSKYNRIPTEFATAKEIGLAAATLCAMARRGMVEVQEDSPKKYRRCNGILFRIIQLCEENKTDFDEYFTLRKSTEKLGMMCSLNKSGDVLDCWGKKYDLTNVCKIEFRTRSFDL